MALIDELEAIQRAAPGSKSLVFTSWPRFLNLVADALKARGIKFAKMLGPPDLRTQQAAMFKQEGDCEVLLILAAHVSGAAGLNLTCATTAFLMEPNLDKSIEDQASGRIYRLGALTSPCLPHHIMFFSATLLAGACFAF